MAAWTESIWRWHLFPCGMLLCVLLTGCASRGPVLDDAIAVPQTAAACRAYFDSFDALATRNHSADRQAARIADFPYLRVDRFLAAMAVDPTDARFDVWVAHLQALDQEARRFELANLPEATQRRLSPSAVEYCGDLLRDSDLADAAQRQRLLSRAVVPDNYSSVRRAFGLYPLTALAMRASISHWQKTVHRRYAETNVAPLGHLQRYAPPPSPVLSTAEVAELLRSSKDALGIPRPNAEQRAILFATYAPVWEIDTVDDDDRPGRPHWNDESRPEVDVHHATVYTHLSYARFEDEVLLQLTYVIWFRARPPAGKFDLLAGKFDGLQWRVMLDSDGRPLVYDSIHPCGCYHLFFPGTALQKKPQRRLYQEPVLIPQRAPQLAERERVRLRVSPHSHYIEGLHGERGGVASDSTYDYDDYDTLRSLPMRDGTHRSLFNDQGYVPGSQRAERWLLWPMGIAHPGTMRQWGLQATAFVGRRHFDEPDLFENEFFRNPAAPP